MDQYLRPNILAITGAWPLPNERVKERLKHINCWINSVILTFGATTLLYDVLYNMSVVYLACKGLTGTLILGQDILKNFSFMVRRDLLREILLSIDDLFENTPLPNVDRRITEKREKYKILAHCWNKIIIGTISPALVVLLGYSWGLYFISNKTDVLIMTVFNQGIKPLGTFILVYLADVTLAFTIALIQIATATLFSSCVLCVCSCVDALKYSLETATQQAIQQQCVTPLFGKCIVYHNKLLILIKNIEKLFSPLLLTQFFVSSTCICVISILLTQVQLDPVLQTVFVTYLVGINTEMFLFCYFGQLVQTKFEMLHMSTFHYPWYEAPLQYQKNICFYLLCSSRPIVLTAGKLKCINLEYYYSLCKLSISYYTLLCSVVGNK